MIVTDGTHLASDSLEELHAFAAGMGLKREWFQDDHYDLTTTRARQRALQHGAILVSTRQLVGIARPRRGGITNDTALRFAAGAGLLAGGDIAGTMTAEDALVKDCPCEQVVRELGRIGETNQRACFACRLKGCHSDSCNCGHGEEDDPC